MAPIPASTFDTCLHRLDRESLAAFVAALWSASGWETTIQDGVVTARRNGDHRRIAVVPHSRLPRRLRSMETPDDVDAIAVGTRGERPPNGAGEARVIDAGDLRDRLLFGIQPTAADRLCETHLGIPARDERWDPSPATGFGVLSTPQRAAALVVVAAIAVVVGGVAFPVLTDSLGFEDASTAVGGGGSGDDGADVPEPTCERGPGEVATLVAGALDTFEGGTGGTQVLWEFSDPEVRDVRRYTDVRAFYSGSQFDALRAADEVVLDGVVRSEDRAQAYVVATGGGDNQVYVVRLRDDEPGEGECWVVQDIAQS